MQSYGSTKYGRNKIGLHISQFRLLQLIRMTTIPASTASDFQQKVAALRALFTDDPSEGQSKEGAWNNAWKKSITPWDNLDVQPALKKLVEENWGKTGVEWEGLVRGGSALIAGCGRVSLCIVYKNDQTDGRRRRDTTLLSSLKRDSSHSESTSLPSPSPPPKNGSPKRITHLPPSHSPASTSSPLPNSNQVHSPSPTIIHSSAPFLPDFEHDGRRDMLS